MSRDTERYPHLTVNEIFHVCKAAKYNPSIAPRWSHATAIDLASAERLHAYLGDCLRYARIYEALEEDVRERKALENLDLGGISAAAQERLNASIATEVQTLIKRAGWCCLAHHICEEAAKRYDCQTGGATAHEQSSALPHMIGGDDDSAQ